MNYEVTEYTLGTVGEWVHVVVYPDWDTKQVEVEVAESFSVQRQMLCASDPSACHVFDTEEAYENFLSGLYAQKYNTTAGGVRPVLHGRQRNLKRGGVPSTAAEQHLLCTLCVQWCLPVLRRR